MKAIVAGFHANKSCVYFNKIFICIGLARLSPEMISGIEV